MHLCMFSIEIASICLVKIQSICRGWLLAFDSATLVSLRKNRSNCNRYALFPAPIYSLHPAPCTPPNANRRPCIG